MTANRNLVVHLTSIHPPRDVRIFHKECRTLARNGFEVRLIAPADQENECDGVRTIPLRHPKNRWDRFTRTLVEMYRLAARQRAAVYHFHDPELALVGLALKIKGCKVIYDVHEGYSEAIVDRAWIPGPMRAFVATVAGWAERAVSLLFDAVVAATPHIAESFPGRKTYVVRNFPMLDELATPVDRSFSSREPSFAFVGDISRGRGLVKMITAAGMVTNDKIRLQIGGTYGEPGIEAELKALPGWSRVTMHGWMSRPQIAELYGNVLAGVVVFQPTKNYVYALPTKYFEYLSAGIPAIVSNFPLLQEVIDKYKCGIAVDPEDPAAIAQAMDWIAANPEKAGEMGAGGRQAVLTEYNWENETKQLLACYRAVLS